MAEKVPTASYPAWGYRVRTKCGATGRYLIAGYALCVSAQDNDLFVDPVDRNGEPPHPTLPVPSNDALAAAEVGWRGHARMLAAAHESLGGRGELA